MRLHILAPALLLALAACEDSGEFFDTAEPWPDDTDLGDDDDDLPGDDDDDVPGDDDDDTDTPSWWEAEYLVGEASVSPGVYLGTETYELEHSDLGLLCAFTYDATGAPFSGPSCTDPDGNACDFAFEVSMNNGAETGGDCADALGSLPSQDIGSYPYGFISDYVDAMGTSFGPSMMYYYEGYGWEVMYDSQASYSGGDFSYEVLWTYYSYTP